MILACVTFASCGPESPTGRRMKAEADSAAAAAAQAAEPEAHKLIPGVQPVDVHLSLKQQGFTVEPTYGDGITWTCKQTHPGVEFRADVYGPEVEKLSLVTATVMADASTKTAEAGTNFLAYVCSVPYDGSNPAQAAEWLRTNFNTDSATTTIGPVRFTLRAPSVAYRLLTIEPAR